MPVIKNIKDTEGHMKSMNKAFYPLPALPHRSVVHETLLTTCFTLIRVYTCIYNTFGDDREMCSYLMEDWETLQFTKSEWMHYSNPATTRKKGGACNNMKRDKILCS